MFGKKIVYGIKGAGVETKKFGLTAKKVIENTGNPKLKQIKDKKYSSQLSKSVYVKPNSFVDFEGGKSKISNKPKAFIKFNDIF